MRPLLLCLLAMACGGSAALTATVDPCGGSSCAPHGHCGTPAGQPACVCDPGYAPAGFSCEAFPSASGTDPSAPCATGSHASDGGCVADVPAFVVGYNFGDATAGDVTVSGNTLAAQGVSGSSSLRLTAGGGGVLDAWATSFLPTDFIPATDTATAALLNHHFSVVPSGSLTIQQGLTNGTYQVFTYHLENVAHHVRHIDIAVQGEQVTPAPLALTTLQWKKMGPYAAVVTNGVLTVELTSDADTSIMGLEIDTTTGGAVQDLPVPQGTGAVGPGAAVLTRLGSPALVFHDEFDTLDAGADRLAGHTWWEGVPRAAASTPPSRGISVAGSILTLTTDDQDGTWTQPALSSDDGSGGGFFFGPHTFLEVRANLSGWSFIHSLPRSWATGGTVSAADPTTYDAEHDWLDNDTTCFNNAFLSTLHLNVGGSGGVADQSRQFNGDAPHTTDGWHTYGFWHTTELTEIYVDDVLIGTLHELAGGDQPLMLVLGVAPGGVAGCGPAGGHAFSLQVDYVRVWQ
jgi:hypothetical protein